MARYANKYGTLDAYNIIPAEIVTFDRFGYKVIAKVTGEYWYAARGLTDWDDEHIADYGDVIPKEAAELLFPTLAQNYIYQA